MNDSLSVVAPCYEDLEKLRVTLHSLENELGREDELIVVDSSASREAVRRLLQGFPLVCEVNYVWIKPEGIYRAQNTGIRRATKEWVEVINAGDRMCRQGRTEIRGAIELHSEIDIHVFGGRAFLPQGMSYAFSPSASSFWPHQSIIVRRSVYETDGVYDEKFSYAADQVYFAAARQRRTWMIHAPVLTEFLLGGRSSGITLKHLRENYASRRAVGTGVLRAFIGGVLSPVARRSLERIIGDERALKLKCYFLGHYRLESSQRNEAGASFR